MSLIKKIRRKLYTQKYVLGFLREDELSLPTAERFDHIRWMKMSNYRRGWFADPFIVSVTDSEITLFAEEFLWKTELGRLSKLTIDAQTYELKDVTPILELSTHLSFPIYVSHEGKLYVYPENYQGGALRIYEYDAQSCALVNPKVLIDRPLLDSQIVEINGAYFVFAVQYANGDQTDTKHLNVYKSHDLFGPYALLQTIENAKCYERGAGMIYTDDTGRIIRPTQDCDGDYGLSVILNELLYDDAKGVFSQRVVNVIEPCRSRRYGRGLHTLNCKNGLCVIDGRGFRYLISRVIHSYILGK